MARRSRIVSMLLSCGFLGSALACGFLDDPEDIAFKVDLPLRVAKGADFTTTIHLTNTSDKAQTLVSLDVADEWLEGIAIMRSEPPFRQSSHIPLDNTWSYEYNLEIPPQGDVTVVLQASALKVGDFSGEIDACINTEINFLSYPIRTLVE